VYNVQVVEKYFPLAYVAFMVNHVEVFGGVDYCPKWNCLPVVWAMFPALVITEICLNTAFTHGIPLVKSQMAGRDELSELRKKAGLKPLVKTPLEEQHGLDDPPKVIFFYRGGPPIPRHSLHTSC